MKQRGSRRPSKSAFTADMILPFWTTRRAAGSRAESRNAFPLRVWSAAMNHQHRGPCACLHVILCFVQFTHAFARSVDVYVFHHRTSCAFASSSIATHPTADTTAVP